MTYFIKSNQISVLPKSATPEWNADRTVKEVSHYWPALKPNVTPNRTTWLSPMRACPRWWGRGVDEYVLERLWPGLRSPILGGERSWRVAILDGGYGFGCEGRVWRTGPSRLWTGRSSCGAAEEGRAKARRSSWLCLPIELLTVAES